MSPLATTLKNAIVAVGLLLVLLVGVPLLALAAIALRPLLIVVLLAGGLVALVLDRISPRFHRWFQTV